MRIAAIIVAAGSGLRFGGQTPKQYELLQGEPVLRRTVRRFLDHPAIDQVAIVISDRHQDHFAQATAGLGPLHAVIGGVNRQSSVLNGLKSLQADPPTHVLIHDAARPLVSDTVIGAVIDGLTRHDAVLPVVAVADSLKRAENGRVAQTVDRDGVVIAQTPQGFAFERILAAHRKFEGQAMSDDTAVAAADGMVIAVTQGAFENIKLTTAEDKFRAEAHLREREMRTACGTGFDVHRLVEGRPLVLCGVEIEHSRGLDGHSDADVGLHAITDAMFGALAEGDIGSHFPPSDMEWKDASSDRFLAFAVDRVAKRGGEIEHIDLTLICEQPKIGPYRDAMRNSIAEIAGVPMERIAVKATTTERLGFAGREEGIAAQAMVTLRLPR